MTTFFFLEALCKFTAALIPLFLMARWNLVSRKPLILHNSAIVSPPLTNIQKPRYQNILLGLLFGLPAVISILWNLLPLTLINPVLFKIQWSCIAAIVLANLGVGLMEEAGCRGVLLPMLCEKWADRKNGTMKAALICSLLFGCAHLSWLFNAIVFHNDLSVADYVNRFHQVYYAFCYGMLWVGMTLYAESILPAVFWHSLIDISAFISNGLLPKTTWEYYFKLHPIGMDTLLIEKGIMNHVNTWYPIGVIVLDTIPLIAGVILVKKTKPV